VHALMGDHLWTCKRHPYEISVSCETISISCTRPTQVSTPCLFPLRLAGTRFTYPGRMESGVDLGG